MTAQFVCEVCTYPSFRRHDACDNPACFANPSVSQRQKDKWRAERDKRDAEESERKRLRNIRRRMISP